MTHLLLERVTRGTLAGPVARRSRLLADVGVAVVAAGLAALAWVSARAAGIELGVRSGSGTSDVNVVAVVVTSLAVASSGAVLLRVLERRTTKARRIWTVLAMAVWGLSFVGPLSATRPASGLVLTALHLIVGAVVVVGLRRTHAPNQARAAKRRVA